MSSLHVFVLVALLLAALAVPQLGDHWLTPAERFAARFAARKGTVIIALAVVPILVRLAILRLYPVPVPDVHDEFSYLLAADTFAHGRLTNPSHPMWQFLDTFHVLPQPTYMSIFPPAQGGALALGQILGHPWIGVLLSVGLMCSAITWMLQGWFPARWALLGGVLVWLRLGFVSYWMNSYWGGAVAAVGGAMVLGALPRIVHHHRSRDAVVLGIGMAILANSRPLEGFVFCIPVVVALAVWLFSKSSPGLGITGPRVLAPLALVLALTIMFVGYYNWRVTGNPRLMPHALYMDQQCNCRVFAWQKPNPPMHYANEQFDHFYNRRVRDKYSPAWNVYRYRTEKTIKKYWHFFLGGVLSIPFVALPWIARDQRMRLLLVQLFLSGAALLAVPYDNAHYVAPLLAAGLAIWVQAMRHLRQWKLFGRPVGIGFTRVIVLFTLVNVPYLAVQMKPQAQHELWNSARARIVQQLNALPGPQLVIVSYAHDHIPQNEWVYNAADIDQSKIVWARKFSDMRPLLAYFSTRTTWLLEADASPPQVRPYYGK
jgi:hypothetical protein